MSEINPQSRFEVSLETRLLTEALTAVPSGQIIPYITLSEVVGYGVVGNDPHLQSALRRAFAQDGAVFSNVRKIGYRRLTDEEIIQNSEAIRQSIGRRAKKQIQRLAAVDFEELPNNMRVRHNTEMSMLNLNLHFAKPKTVAAIEAVVTQSGQALPLAKTLAALK
jgi:hypothetical protein